METRCNQIKKSTGRQVGVKADHYLTATEQYSTTGKYVRLKSGAHMGSIVSVESWEKERKGMLARGERPPEVEYISEPRKGGEKLLPALKPFDPYKFAEYVLRNNVFSDKDTFVYSGLSGTNPHRVPDHYWAEALADMQGEFIKTGDLYVVHTPGVERPPIMRAAPTWREISPLVSTEPEFTPSTINDPLRKFCCRQCGECAPKELLEEGKFPERIDWLRHHYKEKHPGMWGKIQPATFPSNGKKSLQVGDRVKSKAWKEIEGYPWLTVKGVYTAQWAGQPMLEVEVTDGITTNRVFEDTIFAHEPAQAASVIPNPREEKEFVSDSPEFLAYTIEDIGYREKLDNAFETAIARAKGG